MSHLVDPRTLNQTKEDEMKPDIPYGSAVNFAAERRKTKTILTLFALSPVAIFASWMLFPLWFIPVHGVTWGAVQHTDISLGCGVLHVMALSATFIVFIVCASCRGDNKRWPWEKGM